MYEDFSTTERWTGAAVRCVYQCMVVAIATRHADAVDVKFLVNGRGVWIALALPAWAEHKRQTGNIVTDPMAVEMAGCEMWARFEASVMLPVSPAAMK